VKLGVHYIASGTLFAPFASNPVLLEPCDQCDQDGGIFVAVRRGEGG